MTKRFIYGIGVLILSIFSFMMSCSDDGTTKPDIDIEYGSVTDIDGIVYKTVKIGNQWWMAENLNVSHYSNGDSIPEVKDYTTWANLTTDGMCYYNNDTEIRVVYGRLYNWYAVNDPRGLAPVGWHVPSDNEFEILENYLGGREIAGGKLKEDGIAHWITPNTGATNSTSFSALPGGSCNVNGAYLNIGTSGNYWSSSESNKSLAYIRFLYFGSAGIGRGNLNKEYGFSVRCVKD